MKSAKKEMGICLYLHFVLNVIQQKHFQKLLDSCLAQETKKSKSCEISPNLSIFFVEKKSTYFDNCRSPTV